MTPRQTEAAFKLAAGVAAIVLLNRFAKQQAIALGLPVLAISVLVTVGSIAVANR